MAFINTLFPNPRLIHDLQRTIGSATTIIGNGNLEYRIQKQANYRTRWKYPSRAMRTVDARDMARFMAEVGNFSLNSFKFRDPYINQWLETPLLYTGTGNNYYLTTRGNVDSHPVFHLGADVVVKLNGTPVAYTQSNTGGVPVIDVGGTGTVTITGTFYFAVRFDQPEFSLSMSALDINNGPLGDTIGDINLVEVFEY